MEKWYRARMDRLMRPFTCVDYRAVHMEQFETAQAYARRVLAICDREGWEDLGHSIIFMCELWDELEARVCSGNS